MNTMESNIKKTLATEAQTITDIKDTLDYEIVEQIVNSISELDGKLVVSGAGTSGVAAKKIVHTFSCLSIPAVYLNPSDAVHGSLGIVKDSDLVILISKGGNTKELTNLVPSILKSDASIIGVGENKESYIGEKSDLFLEIVTKEEPDPFNMLATASTLAVISCFDAIAIETMKITEFTKTQFGINHPSGAVGKRLLSDQEVN